MSATNIISGSRWRIKFCQIFTVSRLYLESDLEVKYIPRYQASIAHSFGLPEDKALQSVTSIPARSIQQDHRVGYARPGYDADLVVWDSHPLSVGATPFQVFIDGRPLLDTSEVSAVEEVEGDLRPVAPRIRSTVTEAHKKSCAQIQQTKGPIMITGISSFLIDIPPNPQVDEALESGTLSLLLEDHRIKCIGSYSTCVSASSTENSTDIVTIHFNGAHITPGLVAVGNSLGIQDIPSEPSTGDGANRGTAIHFAKYGVHLGSRGFARARIGGVTKAITPPSSVGNLFKGVSVGLRTSESATILDGAIFQDEVALHVNIGQEGKGRYNLVTRIMPRRY